MSCPRVGIRRMLVVVHLVWRVGTNKCKDETNFSAPRNEGHQRCRFCVCPFGEHDFAEAFIRGIGPCSKWYGAKMAQTEAP